MPDITGVHIQRALSDVSIYYRNEGYVADIFSPSVKVNHQADKYIVYGRENFYIGPALRSPKTLTTELEYTLSSDSYFAQEYGYHELIEDGERDNEDDVLNADTDTTEHITDCLLLDREYRVAQSILDSTNADWGAYASTHFTNLAGAWSDLGAAQPRFDIFQAKRMIFKDSRRQANRMLIPILVAMDLCQVDSLDELRKYTDAGLLTNCGLPSRVWGLDISEAGSSYNNAVDGTTENFQETWGNNVVIAFVNPANMTRKTLNFAATFEFQPFEVRKWREEPKRCDVIEITHYYDNKIVAPACGYVYLNATSDF